MSKGDQQKKQAYFAKVHHLFRTYKRIFIANVDNVSSTQMHQIRQSLRGKAVILMGKNTMIKKALKEVVLEIPKLEALVPCIYGNIGLVFTNGDLKEVRDLMVSNRKQSSAKVGLVAQKDIYVPAGNTGIDPNKTSFFQALGIGTKVVKGAIEIANDVLVVKVGQKVGPSEAALLNMLNLVPFSFGLTIIEVYDDGTIFNPSMLDITDDVLLGNLLTAIRNVAACSLAIGYPTEPTVPHLLFNAYKNVLSFGLATEYSFPAVEALKEAMKNTAKAPATASKAATITDAPATAASSKAPAKEEESEEELGLDLFG